MKEITKIKIIIKSNFYNIAYKIVGKIGSPH